jgi:carboxylesterase type B
VPILFGTFNKSTATSAEKELSQTLQSAFANFAKNPNTSPAPNWPSYEPDVSGSACIPTLAKIAYQGNVGAGDFVQLVLPNSTVSTRIDDAEA